jgi:cell shape-determining protein MreC
MDLAILFLPIVFNVNHIYSTHAIYDFLIQQNNLAHENEKEKHQMLQLREDLDKMIYERNEANAKIEAK